MKLRDVESVVEYGKWAQSKGFRVGEHPAFGGVHPVHTKTSLHYKGMALDINYTAHYDRNGKLLTRWKTETEALHWLYDRTLSWARKHGIPLDEMFFNGKGFIKETPTANHPIGGHDGHLHVGWKVKTW